MPELAPPSLDESPRLDVLAIGDAVVDVIATTTDDFLAREKLVKGSMRVLDAGQATRLYAEMGPARETSGGSAANSVAGIAAMGGRAGFVGQVAADQLGEVFAHDLQAQGVEFVTPPLDPAADHAAPTGRCLILVTPDAQRTMNTFPGAAHCLSVDALDPAQIAGAAILYLEAYLWRAERPRAAMRRALGLAHRAGRRVAFTLSDIALIALHRADYLEMIHAGDIDILIANEAEIRSLAQIDAVDDAIDAIAPHVPILLVTCGEKGAVAVQAGQRHGVPAEPVGKVVDTTGAGDLFAAGFLLGIAREKGIERALKMGALAAAEVISHFGARPESDLKWILEE